MSKHYEAFLKEYCGFELAEFEHGYLTFKKLPDSDVVEIRDLYTVPEMRKKGYASEMVKRKMLDWKNEGYNIFYTYIFMDYPYKETSLLASLKFGAKILRADNIKITLGKEF